ncbi:MAG: hypothetical protein JXB03_05260 [Spirochaetales bacterium]|nr:hypothetical protein [Spirochaetales bacterium]
MRKFYAFILLFVIMYFILFPTPLSKTVSITRNWRITLDEQSVSPDWDDGSVRILRSGSRISRIDALSHHALLDRVRYSAAVTDGYFINYDAISQALVVLDADGRYHATIESRGYPYFTGGRLFVIATDRGSMKEWSIEGEPRSAYSFPSTLTALSASPGLIAAGFLNGEAYVYSNDTIIPLTVPEISRYHAVYGIATADQRETVAVVSGINPQFLTVYDKVEGVFVPVFSRSLEDELRRPVYVRFFAQDTYLAAETSGGVDIISVKDWKIIRSEAVKDVHSIQYDHSSGLFLLGDKSGSLVVLSPESAFRVSTETALAPAAVESMDASVLVHSDGRICSFSLNGRGDS